jgi:hypothetical protein
MINVSKVLATTFRPHIVVEFIVVWSISFVLNAGWELSHVVLYTHYQGAPITLFILLRAAVFDAGVITLLAAMARLLVGGRDIKKELMWVAGAALLFAIGLELFALYTGRWVYNDLMPLVPIFNVGWSPTVQLVLTGSVALALARLWKVLCPLCNKYD